MKILMVCLGNICRSPLAEGILSSKTKDTDIIVDSAGTAGYHIGSLPDIRSIEIANKYDIDLKNQRARQFTKNDFNKFNIIYAMDINNYRDLRVIARNQQEKKKVRLILNEINPDCFESVPDPYYGNENGFQEVFNMLNNACNKIANQIG
jgi:protein-tyrosine phosphatase